MILAAMHHTQINDQPFSKELLGRMKAQREEGIVTILFDNNPSPEGHWHLGVPFDTNHKVVSNETPYRGENTEPLQERIRKWFLYGKVSMAPVPVVKINRFARLLESRDVLSIELQQKKTIVIDANWDDPQSTKYEQVMLDEIVLPQARTFPEQLQELTDKIVTFGNPDFHIDPESLMAVTLRVIPRKSFNRNVNTVSTYEATLLLHQYRGESGAPGTHTYFKQTIRAKTKFG